MGRRLFAAAAGAGCRTQSRLPLLRERLAGETRALPVSSVLHRRLLLPACRFCFCQGPYPVRRSSRACAIQLRRRRCCCCCYETSVSLPCPSLSPPPPFPSAPSSCASASAPTTRGRRALDPGREIDIRFRARQPRQQRLLCIRAAVGR